MPDSKITALTSIGTSTDPANDPLVLVDVSDTSMAATGTTKKVTLNNLLACSPTATLASATITGDLTVDTSTLKVDSANNRVGIGTASPSYAADVSVAAVDGLRVKNTLATSAYFNRFHLSNDTGLNFIGYGPSFVGGTVLGLGAGSNSIFSDAAAPFGIGTSVNQPLVFGINGSTAMTLNSTGLGVGVSPAYKGDFNGNIRSMKQGGRTDLAFLIDGNASPAWQQRNVLGHYYNGAQDCISLRVPSSATSNTGSYDIGADGTHSWYPAAGTTATGSTGTPAMLLNANGNLGIGVTPSAWASGFKVIQASTGVAISTNAVVDRCDISANYYFNAGNKFLNATGRASNFSQDGGAFYFYQSTGTSGGVGSAITWGPGMTLDASGRLLVGSSASGTAAGDGVVKLGTYGHCVSQTGASIASGSSVDLTVITSGAGYQGFLSVANTQEANANIRTQTTYSVFGRGTSSTITQIATANGSIGGASFTVTTPSNGVIRITNTSGAAATISAQFFGGASL